MEKSNNTPKAASKTRSKTAEALLTLTLTALLAAMVTICIQILHIPTSGGGYIHVADGVIYLAAVILPRPYAMLAASVGGGLADFLAGYPSYIIPTMIIKALIVLPFSSKSDKMLTKRNLIAPAPALAITVVLYAVAGFALDMIAGSEAHAALVGALSGMPMNVVQAVASAALFYAMGAGLDKLGFKNKFKFGGK